MPPDLTWQTFQFGIHVPQRLLALGSSGTQTLSTGRPHSWSELGFSFAHSHSFLWVISWVFSFFLLFRLGKRRKSQQDDSGGKGAGQQQSCELSSIPGTHTVEGENQITWAVLWPSHAHCGLCAQTHTHIHNTVFKKLKERGLKI